MKNTIWLVGLFVVLMTFVACTSSPPVRENQDSQDDASQSNPQLVPSAPDGVGDMVVVSENDTEEQPTDDDNDASTKDDDQSTQAEENEVVEFSVSARNWVFEPSVIEVKQGQRVRLLVTSLDVPHGFRLPAYDINEVLPPNQVVTIEFVADEVGEFPFSCSVQCGSGHGAMRGKLIVE